jgi:ribosomal protein L37AE/L43A
MRDIDHCDYCGVEEGTKVIDEMWVCKKCFKKIKKGKK